MVLPCCASMVIPWEYSASDGLTLGFHGITVFQVDRHIINIVLVLMGLRWCFHGTYMVVHGSLS